MRKVAGTTVLRAWTVCLPVLLCTAALAAPPVVVQPANVQKIPAGYEFATQELGDPWDFDAIDDTFTPTARQLTNESISAGIYRFDTVEGPSPGVADAQFWLISAGLNNSQRLVSESRNPDTGRRLFKREKFPIDPSFYRYLSLRIRYSSADAQPLTNSQSLAVFYFEDANSISDGTFGGTNSITIPPNQWVTVQIDLANNVRTQLSGSWSDLPQVEGLRIDPSSSPDVRVEVDWVRLVPEPANFVTVEWQGNGAGSYSIAARAQGVAGATAFELVSGVSGPSTQVSLDGLPPGDYRIEVSGNGESGTSPGLFTVNDVPVLEFLSPNIKGDQSKAYGLAADSNPWSSIDQGDVLEELDFESFTYQNPVGSFFGRPTGSTSRLLMNTPIPIDTSLYRMLCFESEIKGPRDIGTGSVTKVLWGNKRSILTTPSPVIAQNGLNEYCVGDMANLRIDPFSSPQAENAWIGPVNFIRFDPHEFPRTAECNNNPSPEACRDVLFSSMILAPFHQADPDFQLQWTDSDSDDNAAIEFYLDDDRIPGNTPGSVEHLIGAANENNGTDSFTWTRDSGVADGLWNVYARLDDGLNTMIVYAGGPLVVGEPPSARIDVLEPDGNEDEVLASPEYGLDDRLDQWDMDVNDLNLARVQNINSPSLAGGMFSGTTANNRSQFILMSTDEGDPEIVTGKYRYLTMKIRISGTSSNHFVQAFFSDEGGFNPTTAGSTTGKSVQEDIWTLVTFDLLNDINSASKADWTDFPQVRSIRIDPTNTPSAFFEIDWITLSAESAIAANYVLQWNPVNTGTSLFDINLVDERGAKFRIAEDLPSTAREYEVDLSRSPLGPYTFEVIAVPGPTGISPGPVRLVEELTVIGVLLRDGFE